MKVNTLILLLALFVSACTSNNNKKASETTTTSTDAVAYDFTGEKIINAKESTIFWKGHKIMGAHTGTINLKDGKLDFENGNIKGGSFAVDMQSVVATKLMGEDEEEEEEEEDESPEDDKSDLANHLMHADFFDAEQFPTATFVIKSSERTGNNYAISGDMTIKDVTKPITFDATYKDGAFHAEIPVDRTEFGIKYGSGKFFKGLGDRVIKDKFDLIVTLNVGQ